MTKEEKINQIAGRLYEISEEVFCMAYELGEYDPNDYRVAKLNNLYSKIFLTKCDMLHRPNNRRDGAANLPQKGKQK